MDDTKNFLLSKTLWGVVIMIIAKIFPKLFSGIDESGVVDNIVIALGAILAIVGRFKAKNALSVKRRKKDK